MLDFQRSPFASIKDKYIRQSPAKFSLDLNEDMCNLICVYLRRGGMENVGLSGHKYKPAPSSIPASFSHASPHLAGEINLWEEARREERQIRERRN